MAELDQLMSDGKNLSQLDKYAQEYELELQKKLQNISNKQPKETSSQVEDKGQQFELNQYGLIDMRKTD